MSVVKQTVLFLAIFALGSSQYADADSYAVTLDKELGGAPRTGRLILFVINKQGWRWDRRDPIEGPFYEEPQPIASMAVTDMKPGDRIVFPDDAISTPVPLDQLHGPIRVQAFLDTDQRTRSHAEGPGNLYSKTKSVTVSDQNEDQIDLILDQVIEKSPPRALPNVRYVEFNSKLLSAHAGFPTEHRAAIVLPMGYDHEENASHEWGVVYVIPGFGGRLEGAHRRSRQQSRASTHLPVVYVLLDPDAPLGHHGFVDSQANGPRATALVEEFIPYLQDTFRITKNPSGHLLTGHSSGGWATLWLQLNHPDVFGGTWSTSPDPIDFSAFGMVDLYEDKNMFRDEAGNARPVYRTGPDTVAMTIKQETDMEWALDPNGGSGQQWDTWESMFSPLDPRTGKPQPLFEQSSGNINRAVVQAWAAFDITRLIDQQWNQLRPIVLQKVHLICGDEDSFYLERAVRRFAEMVDTKTEEAVGGGYVILLEGADHGQAAGQSAPRIRSEMYRHLEEANLLPNHSSTSNP